MKNKLILILLTIALCVFSFASCEMIESLLGGENLMEDSGASDKDPMDEGKEENPSDEQDESAQFEYECASLRSHMAENWNAATECFNFKIMIEKHQERYTVEYNKIYERLENATELSELDGIRGSFDLIIMEIYNNEVVTSYIKEEYSKDVLLGANLADAVKERLIGKTFCIQKAYTGVEEYIITEDFFDVGDAEIMLEKYKVIVGYPVPFETWAYYAPLEISFEGVPDVSGMDVIAIYEISDANPLGWNSIKVYGTIYEDSEGKTICDTPYAEIDGEKFVLFSDGGDRIVITYNGRYVYFTPDKDNAVLRFERPVDDHMKTLTYERGGVSYIFNIYGVRTTDRCNYECTVDITYQEGRTETFTCDGYLDSYDFGDGLSRFDCPMLGLEMLAYDENGVLTEADPYNK